MGDVRRETFLRASSPDDNSVIVEPDDFDLPPVDDLGPAMRALSNDLQRRFVYAYTRLGTGDASEAARVAGYTDTKTGAIRVTAHRLMHHKLVMEAIREEAAKRIDGAVVVAISGLIDIAADKNHKDRQKAIEGILNRTGFLQSIQHNVVVEDKRTERELVEFITAKAKLHGLDPRTLLGRAEVIDGEFDEVSSAMPEVPQSG